MKRLALQPLVRTLLVLACAIALSGCAYWVRDREQVLNLSGFQKQAANTPERRAELSNLPSHQFVRKAQGTKINYVWADPLVCHCLWTGSAKDYKNYWYQLASRSGPGAAGTGFGTRSGEFNSPPINQAQPHEMH